MFVVFMILATFFSAYCSLVLPDQDLERLRAEKVVCSMTSVKLLQLVQRSALQKDPDGWEALAKQFSRATLQLLRVATMTIDYTGEQPDSDFQPVISTIVALKRHFNAFQTRIEKSYELSERSGVLSNTISPMFIQSLDDFSRVAFKLMCLAQLSDFSIANIKLHRAHYTIKSFPVYTDGASDGAVKQLYIKERRPLSGLGYIYSVTHTQKRICPVNIHMQNLPSLWASLNIIQQQGMTRLLVQDISGSLLLKQDVYCDFPLVDSDCAYWGQSAQKFSDLAWSLMCEVERAVEKMNILFAFADGVGLKAPDLQRSIKNSYHVMVSNGFLRNTIPATFMNSLTPFGCAVFHYAAVSELDSFANANIKFSIKAKNFPIGVYLLEYTDQSGRSLYCAARSSEKMMRHLDRTILVERTACLVNTCAIEGIHQNHTLVQDPTYDHAEAPLNSALMASLMPPRHCVDITIASLPRFLMILNAMWVNNASRVPHGVNEAILKSCREFTVNAAV